MRASNVRVAYSLIYFAHFTFVAYQLGFLPLYLKSIGFDAGSVAIFSAVGNIGALVAAFGVLHLTQHFFATRSVALVCAIGLALGFLPIGILSSAFALIAVWFVVTLLSASLAVIIDSNAIRASANGDLRFEAVRVWGSIGFVVGMYLNGILVDYLGIGVVPAMGLVVVVTIAGAAVFLAKFLPTAPLHRANQSHSSRSKITLALLSPNVLPILAVSGLNMASHAAYYVYGSIYFRSLGWSAQLTAWAWNIGVIVEILCFFFFARLLALFSLATILRLSVLATIIRWMILACYVDPILLIFVQALHGFSFGTVFLSTNRLIFQFLPEGYKERGIAFLQVMNLGVGSLGGRLFVGCIADSLTSPTQYGILFVVSALLALLAYLFAISISENKSSLYAASL